MKIRGALSLALLLASALPAWAVGPIVGRNCTAAWTAVTTNTDGSPVTGTITYNLYLQTTATPVPVPGTTTPALTGITATTAKPCIGKTGGQYYLWATAVEQFPGSSSESDLSTVAPFVLAVPGVPGTLTVQ